MHTITSEQVTAWLRAKVEASGIKGMHIIATDGANFHAPFLACPDVGVGERGNTIEEAIANLRAKIPSHEQLAQKKRDDALKLLAEAEELDRQGKPDAGLVRDEPDYDAPRPLTALENWQRNDEHNVA